jgi:TRAP-type uncharacterized transport system substrate-binding protein
MQRLTVAISSVLMAALLCPAAIAASYGTRDEAVAMVRRVQDKYKKEGVEPTLKAVTDKTREFHDRDLYTWVLDRTGLLMAHGGNPDLVGKNIYDMKDQNGKFFIREFIDQCMRIGHGWSDYRWVNQQKHVIEDKSSYTERMGDYCIGSGVYRNEQPNENTIGIISGSVNSDDTYLHVATDLAAVLNDADNLRILPVVGIGGSQNIRDVRVLKGIEIGVTQVNILNDFRRSMEEEGIIDDKIVYISKLYNEEAHLITRSNITSIEQLRGQKVNLDELGSGTNYSMRGVFASLNIKIDEVSMTQVEAIEKLKSGEIAATVLIAGKPARSMSFLKPADGLHFLSIPFVSPLLAGNFLPTTLTHDDYPDMIPRGQSVDTIAVTAVLISYNWPKNTDRYRRIQRFVDAFFPRIADFQKPPRHVKWREVNLDAVLPGWKRFEAAEAWSRSRNPAPVAVSQPAPASRVSQSTPPANEKPSALRPQDDNGLYQEFLRWKGTRQQGNPAN